MQKSLEEFGDFHSLCFINTQDEFSSIWQGIEFKNHFAKDVLYKTLLTSYFKEYDKIIVSDVDVVFLGDVSRSFLDFSLDDDIYISGVRANNPDGFFPLTGWKQGYKRLTQDELKAVIYGVGGGYLIANLKKWRKDNLESKLIEYAKNNAHKLVQAEQDILNIVCYPKIGTLSPAHIVWNAMWAVYGEHWEDYKPNVYSKKDIDDARANPIQLHYIGDKKPWNSPKQPKSDIWYKYLAKTAFLQIHLQELENTIINDYIKTTLPYRIKRLIRNNPLFFIDIRFYIKMIDRLYKRICK